MQTVVQGGEGLNLTGLGIERSAIGAAKSLVPSDYNWNSFHEQKGYLIDGVIRTWDGPTQEIPSGLAPTGVGPSLLGSCPMLTRKEALEALDGAVKAFDGGLGVWPSMSAEQRIQCVERFMEILTENKAEIVKRIIWEIGKTLPDANKEFDRTAEYVRASIVALRTMEAESDKSITVDGVEAKTLRTPRGVTLCMGPFNYPLNETFTTLIPALLMGNTVVFKPPKLGVLLLEPVMEAFQKSFPPGVVNTVYGDGREVVGPLMESGKIDIFAFIGSSKVASILIKQHPRPQRLVNVLGLGTKNPGIILKSANLDAVLKDAPGAAVTFNGQRCTSLPIFYVHRSLADEFAKRFGAAIDGLKGGLPWEQGVTLTPCAEPGKYEWMNELVSDAVSKGASVVNPRGGTVERGVYRPAVLYPIDRTMRAFKEEPFGPVVGVIPFDDVGEVLNDLQESNYGQQASVFGQDATEVHELMGPLSRLVCRVNLNTQCQRGPDVIPFTGRKDSAMGTLSVVDALKVFSLESVLARKVNGSVPL